eukprot:Hpha_TRINITY_DN15804_c0_g1::TRINITY_DN15804_c0_g1_i3::g.190012::m.190012
MAQAAKRKKAEIAKMAGSLPAGVETTDSVTVESSKWVFKIAGPEPYYAGGVFRLNVSIPENYPFKAPDFSFDPATCPYHPSVSWEGAERGSLCPAALGIQDWKPPIMIASVLEQVIEMMRDPKRFVQSSVSPEIAAELNSHEGEFKKKAAQSAAESAKA